MSDYECVVDLLARRVSVRTNRSVDIAKKIAQLGLLDSGFSVRVELCTSLVFVSEDPSGNRWINFWW